MVEIRPVWRAAVEIDRFPCVWGSWIFYTAHGCVWRRNRTLVACRSSSLGNHHQCSSWRTWWPCTASFDLVHQFYFKNNAVVSILQDERRWCAEKARKVFRAKIDFRSKVWNNDYSHPISVTISNIYALLITYTNQH